MVTKIVHGYTDQVISDAIENAPRLPFCRWVWRRFGIRWDNSDSGRLRLYVNRFPTYVRYRTEPIGVFMESTPAQE